MRRRLLILALLCVPWVAQGKTILGRQEFANTARDTLWLTADTLHADPGGPADTLGPVWIAECPKVRLSAAWKGDSLSVIAEYSVDRVNWSAASTAMDGDLFGTAGTQGTYISTQIQDIAPHASATVGTVATSSPPPWLRVRFINTSTIPAYVLNLRGVISCVR